MLSENLLSFRNIMLSAGLIVLVVTVFFAFLRAVRGPRTADRLFAINMIGTMIIIAIAILAVLMNESYLIDICLIYAMISFVAVIVLSKVYIGAYQEKHSHDEKEDDK